MQKRKKVALIFSISFLFIISFFKVDTCFSSQGQLLGANVYLKRQDSTVMNASNDYYQTVSKNLPTGIHVTQTIVSNQEETRLLGAYISPSFFEIQVEKNYMFFFNMSAYGTVVNGAKIEARLYKYLGQNQLVAIPLNNYQSDYLSLSASNRLYWQSKTTQEVTLERLVLKLWFKVYQAGTYYFLYDGSLYPSYLTDPTETRYMRYDVLLGTSQSSTLGTVAVTSTSSTTYYAGIRVFKNTTEITSGTPVAQVSRATTSLGEGYQSATWACPQTSLISTNVIVVKLYLKIGTGAWTLKQTWTTEQLGASSLDSATWTVNYYTGLEWNEDLEKFTWDVSYGSSIVNSRIENFVWTSAVSIITEKLYHSLNVIIGLSQFLKTIYREYSDLTISIGLNQFLKTILSIFSNLNIEVGLTQTITYLASIILYHSLTIMVSLSQYLLSPILPYLIPFWIGFLLLCAIVLGLLLYSER
jgi:hypothetical protein